MYKYIYIHLYICYYIPKIYLWNDRQELIIGYLWERHLSGSRMGLGGRLL